MMRLTLSDGTTVNIPVTSSYGFKVKTIELDYQDLANLLSLNDKGLRHLIENLYTRMSVK